MKKYMSAILLSALSSTVLAGGMMSKGKWDVGIAAGAGFAKFAEDLKVTVTDVGTARYKFNLKGSGARLGLNVGYTVKKNNLLYGLTLGGEKDFYTPRNQGLKNDVQGGFGSYASKSDFKRKYTWELAGTVGHMINGETHIYGKLGAVRSAFREQYTDDAFDVRKNLNGWGGVVGLGLKKGYENGINVGLEYKYQYYEKVGTNIVYGVGGDTKNQSKLRPQYHNILVTLSKSF